MVKEEYKKVIDQYMGVHPTENQLDDLMDVLYDLGLIPAELPEIKEYMNNVFNRVPPVKEGISFDIVLKEVGGAKLQVVKAVKESCGLSLKEAKDLVDNSPSVLKEGLTKTEAEAIQKEIEGAGARITLLPVVG